MPGWRVMVVDDHRMVAEGLATVIRDDPAVATVVCVTSAAAAVEQAAEGPLDVAVVDLRLGDGDGVEVIEALRRADPGIRPVLISAGFTRSALERAIAAGVTAFASKLASGEELVKVVSAAATGSGYASSEVVGLLGPVRASAAGALTVREREVVQMLADGFDVPEIAARLHLSQHTVRNHIRRAMQKLGVRRQLDAVVAASRLGLIELAQ